MYDAILLPTDGRPNTDCAIEEALELAAVHDATLHVLYVINSAEIAPGIDFEDLESIGADAVDHVAALAADSGLDDVRTTVTHGLRARSILEYASEHEVDLLVMGRHRGLERLRRSSLTKQVASDASVPVLVVG